MPCSVPSTPAQPYLGNKTKTSFTIKWTVSYHFFFVRITLAVLSIFSPKKTRCLSHNRWRSEGLILLSQTTRIKLWRRLFLQWQDFRTAWTFARMKFLRSNGFFVKWHLSFCFVDMARTCKRVSGSAFYEPAFWTNKYRLKKNEWFQNGCNKVVIELRVVQFWSEIILVILKSCIWFQTKLHSSSQFNYHY